jgi:hypothetical protein
LHPWDEANLVIPPILNDNLAAESVLVMKLFSFSAQNISIQALLAFMVSVQKSTVILMALPLYVI